MREIFLPTVAAVFLCSFLCYAGENPAHVASGRVLKGVWSVPEGKIEFTLSIKDGKAFMDLPLLKVAIIRTKTHRIEIDHAGETYSMTDLELVINEYKDRPPRPPELQKALSDAFLMRYTGRTEQIAGLICKEFIVCDSSKSILYGEPIPGEAQLLVVAWIAEELAGGKELQKLADSLKPKNFMEVAEGIAGKSLEMPGFAVRSEVKMGEDYVQSFTFNSIVDAEVPDSLFEAPESYIPMSD